MVTRGAQTLESASNLELEDSFDSFTDREKKRTRGHGEVSLQFKTAIMTLFFVLFNTRRKATVYCGVLPLKHRERGALQCRPFAQLMNILI